MSKQIQYDELLSQIKSLIDGENDQIANLANICAAINACFGHHWIGFYIVKDQELVLGPFQGPVACTRIGFGKGVCGKAWADKKAIVVDDVSLFEGHIACSAYSKSEIVIPLIRNQSVWAVLDIDSSELNTFNQVDCLYLTRLCELIP